MSLPVMYARHGGAIRFTANPPARRAGGTKWDAGPVSDWCQCEKRSQLKVLVPILNIMLDPGLGRIERQRAVHRIAKMHGVCTRRRHWPDRESA